jgi:hypothetical protein
MPLAWFRPAGSMPWLGLLLGLSLAAHADTPAISNVGPDSKIDTSRIGTVDDLVAAREGAGAVNGQRPATTEDRAERVAQLMTIGAAACPMPTRLHPVSRLFLESYLGGRMATPHFQRYFSLPNSRYIPLAECLVRTFG